MSSATMERSAETPVAQRAAALLSVRGLEKHYRSGDRTLAVLRGVDFDLAPAEFVAIVGQSGSGKSTLLHLVGLLDAADSGSIHLGDRRIDALPARQRDRLRNTEIGMVFQASHCYLPAVVLHHRIARVEAVKFIANGKMASPARSLPQHICMPPSLPAPTCHRHDEFQGPDLMLEEVAVRLPQCGPDKLPSQCHIYIAPYRTRVYSQIMLRFCS